MKFLVYFLVFLLSGALSAQKKEVLISINGNEISKAEFERIYKKNNQNLLDETNIKSPREYLGLYTDFKLKVTEAIELGMDKDKSFTDELAGYRRELAAPYLTDMKYDETLIKELYERMKKEVNASHILFRINPNAGNEHETAVLKKAQEVRNEILNGKDFNAAALEYSEDPSAKTNKGNLGYFSAFQMVTPFENAAFNTPAGEISEPVRTSFGYHLIKVHHVRENQGEIKVAHIMKMFPREGEFDKAGLKEEIDLIYKNLMDGADFVEMVQMHSDDERSVAEGGEMPWFAANRMVPEFSEPAFALKNKGDITPPVETPFGFHIIKKIDRRPVPSFEASRAEIEARIKKDPERSSSTRKVFIEKLKEEYGFVENRENVGKMNKLALDADLPGNTVLFTIDHRNFYTEDFENFLETKNLNTGRFADNYDAWIEAEIINLEDSKLEEKYPDFKYLMQEYHDGLLFFNIMEEKIWKFAAEDSAGLEKFYRDNQGKFHWEERFDGMVITGYDEEAREEAEKYFEAGITPEEVDDLLNQEEKRIDIRRGKWEKGDNQVVDYFVWNNPAPAELNVQLTFIRGSKIPPEPKTLNEARGMYISAYQDYLEKNWIKTLRKKHKVKVNKRLLKTVPHV